MTSLKMSDHIAEVIIDARLMYVDTSMHVIVDVITLSIQSYHTQDQYVAYHEYHVCNARDVRKKACIQYAYSYQVVEHEAVIF